MIQHLSHLECCDHDARDVQRILTSFAVELKQRVSCAAIQVRAQDAGHIQRAIELDALFERSRVVTRSEERQELRSMGEGVTWKDTRQRRDQKAVVSLDW